MYTAVEKSLRSGQRNYGCDVPRKREREERARQDIMIEYGTLRTVMKTWPPSGRGSSKPG